MSFFDKYSLKDKKFHLSIIALISFLAMLPVLIYGVPYGYDLPHHYQCALTFQESILSGDFYPSWSEHRNFGYGGMETRLYPPISHYTLALFFIAVGNWHIASWLTFLFFTILGGCGVYLWAREYMPSPQAVFAGSIYILLPYHLNQLYNTFFFAEFAGSAVLPFAFFFVSRVCKRGKISDVIGLAVSFAALILTHLPLTVIGSICFTIYGLCLLEREKIFSQITKLAAGVLMGLAASSFFWIKVIQEKHLMAKALIYSDPWLDYRLNFLLSPVQTYVGELQTRIFEASTLYYDLMFLCAVFLTLSCTLPFIIWYKNWKAEKEFIGVWIIFLLSVFLMIPASRFVWDNFTLLQEVQFPWRWLTIVSLTASILSASKLNYLVEWFKTDKRPFGLIICGCILAVITFSSSQIVRQAPHVSKDNFDRTIENYRNKEGFTFWWTIWTRKEAFETKEKVLVKNRDIKILQWSAKEKVFLVAEGKSADAKIAVFYHPNWKAKINEKPTDIKPDKNGAILVKLPSQNEVKVKLSFQETRAVRFGTYLSLFSWLFIFIFLFSQLKNYVLFNK